MVINSMFVDHFLDSILRVEIFFEKKRTTKIGGVDFEIGDIVTSAHVYWRKFHAEPACIFNAFLVTKNSF